MAIGTSEEVALELPAADAPVVVVPLVKQLAPAEDPEVPLMVLPVLLPVLKVVEIQPKDHTPPPTDAEDSEEEDDDEDDEGDDEDDEEDDDVELPAPEGVKPDWGLSYTSVFFNVCLLTVVIVQIVMSANAIEPGTSSGHHWSQQPPAPQKQPPFHEMALSFASIGLSFLAGVFWMSWCSWAYTNVQMMHAQGLMHSPAFAALSWLIPVANLVLPFNVLQEIWRASHPDVRCFNIWTWKKADGSGAVAFLAVVFAFTAGLVALLTVMAITAGAARSTSYFGFSSQRNELLYLNIWGGVINVLVLITASIVILDTTKRLCLRWENLQGAQEQDEGEESSED